MAAVGRVLALTGRVLIYSGSHDLTTYNSQQWETVLGFVNPSERDFLFGCVAQMSTMYGVLSNGKSTQVFPLCSADHLEHSD